jgi:hypothetical protein
MNKRFDNKIKKALENLKSQLLADAENGEFAIVPGYYNETAIVVNFTTQKGYIVSRIQRLLPFYGDTYYLSDETEEDSEYATKETQISIAEYIASKIEIPFYKDDEIEDIKFMNLYIGDYGSDGKTEYVSLGYHVEIK